MKTVLPPGTARSAHARQLSVVFVLKALPSALALAAAQPAWADPPINPAVGSGLPRHGVVAAGAANGDVTGNQLTINQTSARAVLDWTSFDIDAGKWVVFNQINAASAVLNRVSGSSHASQIMGHLRANGTVMLMNPNGLMFGLGSTVNVGSLIATTGTVLAADFMADGHARITGATGNITNRGSISTTGGAGAMVALVAPSVINQGDIMATGGTIALAGSTAATISLNNGLYEFAIPAGATGTEVSNTAGASLQGATIRLGAGDAANLLSGVINLEGVQQATNAIVVNGHTVELKSALQATSVVSGNSNIVNVSGAGRIQDGVNIAKSGGAVNVAAGSYVQPATLKIEKSLTLSGAGEGATVIDSRGINGNGIEVKADNVTLKDFTLYGPLSYGIKVAPASATNPAARLRNFAIRQVTIRGSGRAELDLNGVDGALIDRVTADGLPFGGGLMTEGAGIQITDSANVTVRNSTTRDNKWGGLAIYQANRYYDQQVNNIRVEANNNFTEINPVYLQDESASRDFGTLNIDGFDFAVRNTTTIPQTNFNQYTWLQRTRQDAFNYAVNIPDAPSAASYVQGWNGAVTTQNFHVGTGSLLGGGSRVMSIGAAVGAAAAGAVVNVAAGTYAESVNITKALTLDGAGMDQTILKAPTASGNAVTITGASDVTISDLAIADSDNGLLISGTSNNVTVNRVAFNNNRSGIRTGTTTRADNFRMLNSTITGGQIGVQTYNSYEMVGGVPVATGSFENALFENVTVDGPTFKGFYFETANNLTLKDVTVINAGNYGAPVTSGDQHMKYGSAIDINLKYDAFDAVTLQNVLVKNSGHSSGNDTRAAVVIKTRGIPGDSSAYTAAPASLQSVNIIGGGIEGSTGTGLRLETLSNGSGGQPTVIISGGTQFRNNAKDIVVDRTHVDARGAVFAGAANGFAVEDRVTHALDSAHRGLVTWTAGHVYVTPSSGSIQRGVDAAGVGNTVNVAAGTFAEDVALSNRYNLLFNDTRLRSLALNSGAAGSGIGGAVTAEGAGGFRFNVPVNLLADTTLTTLGADITFNSDIQNAGGVARALRLIAGSGGTRGNVHMTTGGSLAGPLGQLDISANRFSLDSTLWVRSYKIDALGDVTLSNSTLRAQDTGAASTLNAGGDVTGSTISQGSVEVISAGDIDANIAGTDVVAQAQGAMDVVVTASQTATLTADTIVGNITAADVVAQSQGDMNVVVIASNTASLAGDSVVANVTAPVVAVEAVNDAQISGAASQITLDAPRGSVTGSFGQVSNTGSGLLNVNGKPQSNQAVSANAENNRVVPAGSALDNSGEGDGGLQVARADMVTAQADAGTTQGTPETAGDLIDSGVAVELDLSPGPQRNRDKKTNVPAKP